jgi:hypothetical protein
MISSFPGRLSRDFLLWGEVLKAGCLPKFVRRLGKLIIARPSSDL